MFFIMFREPSDIHETLRHYRLAPTKNASVAMEMTELDVERREQESLNRIELVETVTCRAEQGEEDEAGRSHLIFMKFLDYFPFRFSFA